MIIPDSDRLKQMLHSDDTTTVDIDFEASVIVGEVGPRLTSSAPLIEA